MPLPNRVDPFGNLFADPARGLFFGNRGGRFHRDDRTLGLRRWVSRTWICCRLAFKGRHRSVWGAGYTELFFLDEPTALAAGHRPCFECRRHEAQAFAAALARGLGRRVSPRAAEMDRLLHAERLDGRAKRSHRLPLADLPDGALLTLARGARRRVRGARRFLLRWTPSGYVARRSRPRGIVVDVLTPPATLLRCRWLPAASAPERDSHARMSAAKSGIPHVAALMRATTPLPARVDRHARQPEHLVVRAGLAPRELAVARLAIGLGLAGGVDRQSVLAVDQHDVVAGAARELDDVAVAGRSPVGRGTRRSIPSSPPAGGRYISPPAVPRRR